MSTTNPDETNSGVLLQSSAKSPRSPGGDDSTVVEERAANKQDVWRQEPQEVEFLPGCIRYQRIRRKRLIRQGYLMAVCVVAMVVLTFVRQGRISQARANLATFEKTRVNLQKQVSMIASLENQVSDLLIKKQIDEEIGGRTDCTVILSELCRITPPSIVIISLDLQTVEISAKASESVKSSSRAAGTHRGARPTVAHKSDPDNAGKTILRTRMVVTGLAMSDVDVANFIGQLAGGKLFENVNMGYTKTVTFRQRSAREFRASCYLTR